MSSLAGAEKASTPALPGPGGSQGGGGGCHSRIPPPLQAPLSRFEPSETVNDRYAAIEERLKARYALGGCCGGVGGPARHLGPAIAANRLPWCLASRHCQP